VIGPIRRAVAVGPVVALVVAGAMLAPGAPAIVATDLTAGAVVVCRPLPEAERVALVYTHSMYGGDVVEEFVATDDGRLRRVALTTGNEAAAEYYAHTAGVERVGGRFRVEVPAAEFEELVVRVDRVGGHRLRVGGEEVDLLAATGDRRRLRLEARPVGFVQRIFGDGC
jgi:hypothetical protein